MLRLRNNIIGRMSIYRLVNLGTWKTISRKRASSVSLQFVIWKWNHSFSLSAVTLTVYYDSWSMFFLQTISKWRLLPNWFDLTSIWYKVNKNSAYSRPLSCPEMEVKCKINMKVGYWEHQFYCVLEIWSTPSKYTFRQAPTYLVVVD